MNPRFLDDNVSKNELDKAIDIFKKKFLEDEMHSPKWKELEKEQWRNRKHHKKK